MLRRSLSTGVLRGRSGVVVSGAAPFCLLSQSSQADQLIFATLFSFERASWALSEKPL